MAFVIVGAASSLWLGLGYENQLVTISDRNN